MADFAMTISDHKHLALGGTELRAVLTVTAAAGLGSDPGTTGLSEVIVVDTSGSMISGAKMADARRATIDAVEALPDFSRFAIVAGDQDARMVYPPDQRLAVAGPRTRREARSAIKRLHAFGGTAMSTWLTLAKSLLAGCGRDVRHVTLLTDGRNTEREGRLPLVLAECRDVFQCDARGIGADWNARELIGIAEALRGQARAVTVTSDLAADFRAIVRTWTAKAVPELTLRLGLSPFATLKYLRQVHPVKADVGAHAHPVGGRTLEIATGAWAAGEQRDYDLCVVVGDAGELHEDLRAGRIDLVSAGKQRADPAVVLVRRIADDYRSALPDPKLREYSEQEEMSRAIGDGCGAYLKEQRERAEALFGQALVIAQRAGDQDMARRLLRVVQVEDQAAGRVRLRADVRVEDLLDLETESRFSQVDRSSRTPSAPGRPGADKVCVCGWVSPGSANFCTRCRQPL